MQKRIIAAVAAVLTGITAAAQCMIPKRAAALTFTPNTAIRSNAAVLYNMDVDTIVFEKNADMKEMPAALAQIMTAVIVLESCPDITKDTVTAATEMFAPFADYEYQSDLRYAEINAGDTLTVEDLLYAMMLTSSCEASIMLATHFGDGSEAGFVEKMNAKAEALGMTNTRYTNATGLYSARQLTTARDMMTLLKYAMTVPSFEAISCAQSYLPPTAAGLGKSDKWNWKHSNTMSVSGTDYYCNGVRGIKTGNLQETGRSIACTASRDGNNYLLVCLNAPMNDDKGKAHFYHLEDAKTVLNWAFMHLSYLTVVKDNSEEGEIPVVNADGDDFIILKPESSFSCIWCDTADVSSIQKIKSLPSEVKAPVQKGDKIGTLTLKLSGETLAEINLVAASSVERSFWKYNLAEIPGFLKSKYLRRAWVIALILSLIYIGICIYAAVRFRMDRKKRPQRPRQPRT